jgi:hypothetical protein
MHLLTNAARRYRLPATLCAVVLATGASLGACGSDTEALFGDGGGGSGDDTSSSDTTSATGAGGAGGSTSAETTTTTTAATTTTASGGGGAPPCPGLGDACTECMAWDCSDTYCACSNNAECGTLLTCLAGCGQGNEGCTNSCLAQHENGISDALLVSDCSATTCQASCPAGGVPLDACQKCLFVSCAPAMNKCLADPECQALIACIAECAPNDDVCFQTCAFQHFGALADAQAVGECASGVCAASCGG